MNSIFIVGLLASAVRIAAPLIMGALGGLISERAGVFAVGIEGMMLAGAFGSAVATFSTGMCLRPKVYGPNSCQSLCGVFESLVTRGYTPCLLLNLTAFGNDR